MSEKFILHYAGQQFSFDHDPLAGVDLHEPATVFLNRGEGRSVKIATGPGIPIMVQGLGERGPARAVFL